MIGACDSKIIEKYSGFPTAELWGTQQPDGFPLR
jgi:hypothetical protein